MKKYQNIDEFYKELPVRAVSGESDFGCWWRCAALRQGHCFRITLVQKTGEFYLCDTVTDEIYLMDNPVRESPNNSIIGAAEVRMRHWADKCGKQDLSFYFPEVTSYDKTQT
jgi:hypothetical protein